MHVGGALTSFSLTRDHGVSIFAKLTVSRHAKPLHSPCQPVLYCVDSLILAAVCSADFSNVLST